MFKKGDIAARVTTTVAHFGFGSGRAPTMYHSIEIVLVDGASKEGSVRRYKNFPASPSYKHDPRYSHRVKWLAIGGENQERARRLFEAAKTFDDLRFDDQEAAKAAIANA